MSQIYKNTVFVDPYFVEEQICLALLKNNAGQRSRIGHALTLEFLRELLLH
jgi:hypothetical protein